MPSLIDLRRRMRAVKNTQQITKAMKMVAASKLRRAQERILNARPYAVQMQRVLASVAARVDASMHPLLDARGRPDRTARRWSSSSAPTRVSAAASTRTSSRPAGSFIAGSPQPCALGLVGRKGRDLLRPARLRGAASRQVGHLSAAAVRGRAGDRADGHRGVRVGPGRSRGADLQRVQVGHVAAGRRRPAAADRARRRRRRRRATAENQIDYLYEPSPQEIFDQLLPRYVEVQVYRALLESNAAFFAAQTRRVLAGDGPDLGNQLAAVVREYLNVFLLLDINALVLTIELLRRRRAEVRELYEAVARMRYLGLPRPRAPGAASF